MSCESFLPKSRQNRPAVYKASCPPRDLHPSVTPKRTERRAYNRYRWTDGAALVREFSVAALGDGTSDFLLILPENTPHLLSVSVYMHVCMCSCRHVCTGLQVCGQGTACSSDATYLFSLSSSLPSFLFKNISIIGLGFVEQASPAGP